MMPGNSDNPSPHRALRQAVSAVAVGLALIVISYGIAKPPQQALPSSDAVIAAARSSPGAPDERAREDSASSVAAANQSRGMTFEQHTARFDAPRECAIEMAVTDACTFN